jgi:hypothetical protein
MSRKRNPIGLVVDGAVETPPTEQPPALLTPMPDPIVDIYVQLAELCRQLPEAKGNLTERWYGEEFQPQYEAVRNKIKALLQ